MNYVNGALTLLGYSTAPAENEDSNTEKTNSTSNRHLDARRPSAARHGSANNSSSYPNNTPAVHAKRPTSKRDKYELPSYPRSINTPGSRKQHSRPLAFKTEARAKNLKENEPFIRSDRTPRARVNLAGLDASSVYSATSSLVSTSSRLSKSRMSSQQISRVKESSNLSRIERKFEYRNVVDVASEAGGYMDTPSKVNNAQPFMNDAMDMDIERESLSNMFYHPAVYSSQTISEDAMDTEHARKEIRETDDESVISILSDEDDDESPDPNQALDGRRSHVIVDNEMSQDSTNDTIMSRIGRLFDYSGNNRKLKTTFFLDQHKSRFNASLYASMKTLRSNRRDIDKDLSSQERLNIDLIQEDLKKEIKSKLESIATPQVVVDKSLVPLTEEEENLVDEALDVPKGEIVREAFNITVQGHDIKTLLPGQWLNDEVINFYAQLLMERSKASNDESITNKVYPKIHCFNTFFFAKLSQGYMGVRSWSRRFDLFSMDKVIIPIHLGNHWICGCINLRDKIVGVYDSLGGRHEKIAKVLLNYLVDDWNDKKIKKGLSTEPFDTSEWEIQDKSQPYIPQQLNGYDCGVFACSFMESLSRDATFSFSQDNMEHIRRRIVLEITEQKLVQ